MTMMAACGSDPLPAAELGAVCGEAGPFRVLELTAGQKLTAPPQASGERVVFRIGEYGAPSQSGSPPEPTDIRLWSTGICGESPMLLDAGLDDFAVAPPWPDMLLGLRTADGTLELLDATDGGAGHVVFAGVGPSRLFWTEHGLISFEGRGEDTGAMLLHP